MKIKRHKIISFICVTIIFFITNLTQTNAIGNNAYTVINSQTLLESNTLDTLTLNYTKLPSISVLGTQTYITRDDVTPDSSPKREIEFTNTTAGKTLNSVVTVNFNNCGRLNNKPIDMKLVYSDIVTKGDTPCLYWSAYGNAMATNNEWWYRNIEHVTVKIYFYYVGSNTPITLNTAYLSLFSEDRNEGASSTISTNQYLYENTYMEYLPSTSSTNVSRIYRNVFRGTVGSEVGGNTEAGTAKCVSFQYKNTNNIQVELYALGNKVDVGYHLQYDSLTATIPNNPKKTVDKTVANTGDTVTYTVTQNISKALDKNFCYKSLVFKDVLNSNLAYVSLTVNDPNNKNITNTAGTTTFDSSSKTLKYTFSSNYLKNMSYKGQIYKFIIKAKINSSTTSGNITNTSSTIINNNSVYTLKSNTTTTKIPYKVIVNHVDEKGKKLVDSEIIQGYEKDKYTTKSKSIYGYELTKTPANSTGTMTENVITVTYRYKLKATKIVAKYVNEQGKEIAESETVNGKVFDKYSTEPKNIYGYKLIKVPENKDGTMEENTINVTYKYELKDTKVVTKYVNEEGKEIAESETVNGKVFDKYSTKPKKIYGYKLIEEPKNKEGIMEENTINVTYKYELKDTKVVTKYVNEEGKEIAESETVNGKVFDKYSTEPKNIYGYKLIKVPENKDGTMEENAINVTYKYELKDTKVVTKYVNEEGKEIAESETVNGKVFDEYSTKPKSIYGYELVEIPLNCKGTMKEYNITVVYYYTIKNTKVITKYVNEEGKEIAESEIVNGKVFDKYSTESKNIYGYKLTEEPENKNGIMEENTINVTYKYQLKDTKVVTKYVDEQGKEIVKSETVNGKVFDKYSTEPKNIYGYKLIEDPKNKKGIMEEDTINVTYKYQLKDTKVVTKYVDEQGKEIADSESLEGKVFDKYSTKSKNIYGYKLIEEPSNKEGIMVEDTTDVIYRYKLQDSEVISRYLDTEGKEIAENKITKGKVFSNYTTEPKEIEGYKLIEIPKNKNGIMQENNNIVTYNYRKLEFNISVSQKLAKVILNNNEIKGISKKLEIDRKTNVNSLKLIYSILVSNHSELDGTTVIYYDIPDGYVALEQENIEWTINGKVAYRKVDDLVVNSSKDFTITLTATSSEVVGTLANKVTCKHSNCKVGYQETTLTDNVDITELIISISTGLKKDTIEIVLVILIVLIVSVIILCIAKKMTSKCKR